MQTRTHLPQWPRILAFTAMACSTLQTQLFAHKDPGRQSHKATNPLGSLNPAVDHLHDREHASFLRTCAAESAVFNNFDLPMVAWAEKIAALKKLCFTFKCCKNCFIQLCFLNQLATQAGIHLCNEAESCPTKWPRLLTKVSSNSQPTAFENSSHSVEYTDPK